MPGSAASARLSRPARAAGTHSLHQVQRHAVDGADRPAVQRLRPAASRRLDATAAGGRPRRRRTATRRDSCRPDRGPRTTRAGTCPSARVWWKEPPVTNQPEPCRLSTSPCSRSSSSARRTVTRLAPYRCPSTASLSRAPESPRSPRAMRSRTSSAMVRNRAPVINLYATSERAAHASTGGGAAGIRGLAGPLLALRRRSTGRGSREPRWTCPGAPRNESQGVATHAFGR